MKSTWSDDFEHNDRGEILEVLLLNMNNNFLSNISIAIAYELFRCEWINYLLTTSAHLHKQLNFRLLVDLSNLV